MKFIQNAKNPSKHKNARPGDLSRNIKGKMCRIYAEHPNKHSYIKYKLLQTNRKHPLLRAS